MNLDLLLKSRRLLAILLPAPVGRSILRMSGARQAEHCDSRRADRRPPRVDFR
jgi:hypothetical protein